MKAITLWQPWASAIFSGSKLYETRSWPTAHRGPLLIHAGKKIDMVFATGCGFVCPCGYILGAVDVVDCVSAETVPENERAWGDFTPGRWAWKLANPRALREPIRATGKQGIWSIDDSLLIDLPVGIDGDGYLIDVPAASTRENSQ